MNIKDVYSKYENQIVDVEAFKSATGAENINNFDLIEVKKINLSSKVKDFEVVDQARYEEITKKDNWAENYEKQDKVLLVLID